MFLLILSDFLHQFSSVTQSCLTLCDPMNHSMPGLPVHHQLPESTQTHDHWVGDAIQPSHPLSSPSPPAPNPSQDDHKLLSAVFWAVNSFSNCKWKDSFMSPFPICILFLFLHLCIAKTFSIMFKRSERDIYWYDHVICLFLFVDVMNYII